MSDPPESTPALRTRAGVRRTGPAGADLWLPPAVETFAVPPAWFREATLVQYEDNAGSPATACTVGAAPIAPRGTVSYFRGESPSEIRVVITFAGLPGDAPVGAPVYLLQCAEEWCSAHEPLGVWTSASLTETFSAPLRDGAVRFATHIGPISGAYRYTSGPVLLS